MTQTLELKDKMEGLLRTNRLPHVWCSGCGIGIVLNSFLRALIASETDENKVAVSCGIGCTARISGYMNIDGFHMTHGRALAFATGLKLANPALKTVAIGGDGDMIAIGGNHFIHAARRNIDMLVICVNNFNYGMTGGQAAPTTTKESCGTTAPYGSFENPFNLPFIADACGAVYVARWTAFHVRQLQLSIQEALKKKGFSFIEIFSQCTELFLRKNKYGAGLDEMKFFKQNSVIKNGADTREAEFNSRNDKIVVGKFVDRERPDFKESMDGYFGKVLKDKFIRYEGPLQTKI
ncbi:MAG: 2-oxoacid:ferredoxin oxidoreductase subunit beta [Elusimicrobia bacterium]|nr:2-oxoacid:ferredoxin oxidoreductase subunit beta [Elusimicrobiota bacterium]